MKTTTILTIERAGGGETIITITPKRFWLQGWWGGFWAGWVTLLVIHLIVALIAALITKGHQ